MYRICLCLGNVPFTYLSLGVHPIFEHFALIVSFMNDCCYPLLIMIHFLLKYCVWNIEYMKFLKNVCVDGPVIFLWMFRYFFHPADTLQTYLFLK